MKDTILAFARDFFTKLQIDVTSIDVMKEKEGVYLIELQSEDSSILIGPHGSNISNLQKILSMAINNEKEEHTKIKLEINDYYKSKDEKLYQFIDEKMRIVSENGGEYRLPKYSSYERKKIHSYVAYKDLPIITKSKGEGEARRLYLIRNFTQNQDNIQDTPPQKTKLTIDIDGDDI